MHECKIKAYDIYDKYNPGSLKICESGYKKYVTLVTYCKSFQVTCPQEVLSVIFYIADVGLLNSPVSWKKKSACGYIFAKWYLVTCFSCCEMSSDWH